MAKRVLILRAAGINCDEETAFAWEQAGAAAERVHVGRVIEAPATLDAYDALTIPGGFSYGDDVAAGRILANQLVHHLAEPLRRFVESGRPILGICNGFQVLVRAGLLPGLDGTSRQSVTLTNNDTGRFEARWVHLRPCTRRCVFLRTDAILALPIAHGEGKLVPADDATRAALHAGDHVALRYCDESGGWPTASAAGDSNSAGTCAPFPINPNGSVDDIAGLTDRTGLILGLMPHPERHVQPTQHPAWASRPRDAVPSGRLIFASVMEFLRGT